MSSDNSTTRDSSNVYRIEPLRGQDNFATWRVKMSDILTSLGVWDYISGSTPEPALVYPGGSATPSAESKKDSEEWKKKDRSALTAIRLRVADHIIVSC